MNIGTKSVLFGVHCFFVHPWFVLWAWLTLYGFPFDLRLWIAFVIHDLGYFGKPNMDGPEGERHTEFAADIMGRLFDSKETHWSDFCKYHSRFIAKRDSRPYSRLCVADKLAIALTPAWIYLPLSRLSGEIFEYMNLAKLRTDAGEPKYASMKVTTNNQARWYADVQEYIRRWVDEHRDGKPDKWTPKMEGTK